MQARLSVLALGVLASVSVFAATNPETTNLYQYPSQQAQVVEAIAKTQVIAPFYREGDWVKVGDISNGKVGWVYSPSLAGQVQANIRYNPMTRTFTFKQNTPAHNGAEQVHITSTLHRLSAKETKALFKQIERQQQRMEQSILRMQQQIFGGMNNQLEQLQQLDRQNTQNQQRQNNHFLNQQQPAQSNATPQAPQLNELAFGQQAPKQEQKKEGFFSSVSKKIKSVFN